MFSITINKYNFSYHTLSYYLWLCLAVSYYLSLSFAIPHYPSLPLTTPCYPLLPLATLLPDATPKNREIFHRNQSFHYNFNHFQRLISKVQKVWRKNSYICVKRCLSLSFASILFKNISGIEQTFILCMHPKSSDPDPNFCYVRLIE